MLYEKKDYLEVCTKYDENSIEIKLGNKRYRISYPENIWRPLDEGAKKAIVDHAAFMATNYLPLVLGKKGVIYDTRLPMFDCFSFKSMMYDLPSSAVLDGRRMDDYVKSYFNLDFVFVDEEPVVFGTGFESEETAVISFTSGKESLLTLAMCRELGIEPILINIVEPSNTHEHEHKMQILRGLNREFGIEYYSVPHEPGLFHDARWMKARETSLGWGNQLMYYLFLYLPFIVHHRARYLFYGNEFSCDKESSNSEGFRANFCYDQSTHWTTQMDVIMRTLTRGSTRVGSLVGPLNEIAVIRALHDGFPELAKYQMSCFCEDPVTEIYRWCCNCSKCARNYAFIKANGGNVEDVGFWRDMFSDECSNLFSALGGEETYGFDRSGLGREEQELALFLASMNMPENEFLQGFASKSTFNNGNSGEQPSQNRFNEAYNHYLSPQYYRAIPEELRERVYATYNSLLLNKPRDLVMEQYAHDDSADMEKKEGMRVQL